jgi:hypothetical protein
LPGIVPVVRVLRTAVGHGHSWVSAQFLYKQTHRKT